MGHYLSLFDIQGGAVAQLVEQRTENPCVGGSIPPHTTKALAEMSGFFILSGIGKYLCRPDSIGAHTTKALAEMSGFLFYPGSENTCVAPILIGAHTTETLKEMLAFFIFPIVDLSANGLYHLIIKIIVGVF